MKILVLGASGLLGHAVLRELSRAHELHVVGTVRTEQTRTLFSSRSSSQLIVASDLERNDVVVRLFRKVQPDVVINCVALRKEDLTGADHTRILAIFSVLPQRLSQLCLRHGARLIHISSDGVFSGAKGGYTEEDFPDAKDIYGIAKFLGEVHGCHTITLRTSIIGHELRGFGGLLEWFLAQKGQCRCYSRSIFSGLPAVVLGEIIRDIILPRPELEGVYHLASEPISKFELLTLVGVVYGKNLTIVPDDKVVIDRSLVADKFFHATGFKPPEWRQLIQTMYMKSRKDRDV